MIIDFFKKIFSYFVKFILIFFSKNAKNEELIKSKVDKQKKETIAKSKVITSLPDSESIKSIYNFSFKKNNSKLLYEYIKITNDEIIKVNNDLKYLLAEILKEKTIIGYNFELNILNKRIKKLEDDYQLLKSKSFFKTSNIEIREIDVFKLLKNDDVIKRTLNMFNYIQKLDFSENTKKVSKPEIVKNKMYEEDTEQKAKTSTKENGNQKIVVVKSKSKIKEESNLKSKTEKKENDKKNDVKKDDKKNFKKEENKKVLEYDDIFNSIDSSLETIKINNRIKKQIVKGKRKTFSALLFLISFAKSIQLKLKISNIKNELRQEYVDSVNINNTVRNMRNIIADVELEYINIGIDNLTNLSKTKEKTIEMNLDIIEQINKLEIEVKNKFNNQKSFKLINKLNDLKFNIEYQMKEIPELKKKKEKIII